MLTIEKCMVPLAKMVDKVPPPPTRMQGPCTSGMMKLVVSSRACLLIITLCTSIGLLPGALCEEGGHCTCIVEGNQTKVLYHGTYAW